MPMQQTEAHELVERTPSPSDTTMKLGWNISQRPAANDPKEKERALSQNSINDVHMSHKQITDRFVELLNLFETYTRIVEGNRKEDRGVAEASGLKRTKSEQLVQKEDLSDLTKSSASLSDCTLVGFRKPTTSEISCQTSWTLLEQYRARPKTKAGPATSSSQPKPSKLQQHTIHIEVESVSSATALQRAPLRQRLWHIVVQIGDTLMACTYMIGENFTYILFILLCIWCLYLVIGHYYSFLQDNVNRQATRPRLRNQPT